ncbi:MAG: hypothetical protein ACE5EC_04700, partial [Phycisphaerae bacterium]
MNHPLIHSICLSLSAFCLILPASARAAQDPESPSDPIASVVRIPARAKAALSALRVQPRMSIDYGAFVWMEVEAGDLAALESAGVALEAQQDPYTLRLGEMRFDPLRGPPAPPAGWDVVRQDVADMHLVQFKAPTRSAWLDQVRDRDVEIIQYIHPHTYIVWGLAADVDNLSAIDAVRWTGPSVPAYRVLPPWRNLPAAPLHTRMLIYRGADPAGILDALAVLGGVNIETTHLNGVFTSVRLTLPGDRQARPGGLLHARPQGGLRSEEVRDRLTESRGAEETAVPNWTRNGP